MLMRQPPHTWPDLAEAYVRALESEHSMSPVYFAGCNGAERLRAAIGKLDEFRSRLVALQPTEQPTKEVTS